MKSSSSRIALLIAVVCFAAAAWTARPRTPPRTLRVGSVAPDGPPREASLPGSPPGGIVRGVPPIPAPGSGPPPGGGGFAPGGVPVPEDDAWITPPRRDPSTPARQNGFVLREMQSRTTPGPFRLGNAHAFGFTESGGIALWIAAPWFPDNAIAGGYSPSLGPAEDFTVTARPEGGEPAVLRWFASPPNMGEERTLCAVLPAGYPPTIQHFDVTVRDRMGNHARWRLGDLPQTPSAFPTPVRVVEKIRAAGIVVKASAWRSPSGPAPAAAGFVPRLEGRLETVGAPKPEGSWELAPTGSLAQWERDPTERLETAGNMPPGPAGTGSGLSPLAALPGTPVADGAFAPVPIVAAYPHLTRYVRIQGTLRRFATYTERVAFQNLEIRDRAPGGSAAFPGGVLLAVKKAENRTTPSGLTVLLLAGPAERSGPALSGQGVAGSIALLVRPSPNLASLPDSPLFRVPGKPISVELRVAPPYRIESRAPGPGSGAWRIVLPAADAKTIPPLTVVVTQRTELEDHPLVFTVPVQVRAPRQVRASR